MESGSSGLIQPKSLVNAASRKKISTSLQVNRLNPPMQTIQLSLSGVHSGEATQEKPVMKNASNRSSVAGGATMIAKPTKIDLKMNSQSPNGRNLNNTGSGQLAGDSQTHAVQTSNQTPLLNNMMVGSTSSPHQRFAVNNRRH